MPKIEFAEDEIRMLLSCLDATDMLYKGRKDSEQKLQNIRRKLAQNCKDPATHSSILQDMVRGR